MNNPTLIADETLEINEKVASSILRDEVGEKNITLLGKATRLRLYLHSPVLHNNDLPATLRKPDVNYFSIGLRCTLHPDFDHVIKHARLTVDFTSNTPDILIKDIFPREVTEPVSYKREVKVTAGLEFSFIKLSGEISQSNEFEYYFPKIMTYGLDSKVAYFDFISTSTNELKIDNMLYMFVRIKGKPALMGRISINATVRMKNGIEIPLITKKTGKLNEYIKFV